MNRMGDFVLPALSFSTQLDEGICVTISVINVSQHLIQTIILLKWNHVSVFQLTTEHSN